MEKEKLVVLTGAGMSADSGISTFRDSEGLWEGVDVMEVASVKGWETNPEKVLEFYNERRRQLQHAKPNAGHYALVELEQKYEVTVVTQNVDDLHERAGSQNVIHLHGELTKARPEDGVHTVFDIGYSDINLNDCDDRGRQLRPAIVWFGEIVPMMEPAIREVGICDLLLVIGTSLVVYPAAGLVDFASLATPVYVVDPHKPEYQFRQRIVILEEPSISGTPKLVRALLKGDNFNKINTYLDE